MEQLQETGCHSRVAIISQDSYYKGLTPEESANAASYNFDHPMAFDWDLIRTHLQRLKSLKPVDVPTYSFVTHQRVPDQVTTLFADVVLFEGILSFWEESVRDLFDMKIFVDTEDDIRLIRRIRRDTKHRGRTLESVLDQYEQFVKPAFDQFIAPTKKFADVVVPRGETNTVAISLITMHIRDVLSRPKKR
jgi:uridine kinase